MMRTSLLARRAAKIGALLSGLMSRPLPGLVVVLYHRVGVGDRYIDLGFDLFKRQADYLADSGRVVSLEEGLRRVSVGPLDDDVFAITFDDGTEDFFTTVLPVLVERGLPATHYVVTGPVDEGLPYPSWAGPNDARAMSWGQIAEAVSTGLVTVGSHTHTHADLDRVDKAAIEAELRRSKELIEDRVGRACSHFAYPHAVGSASAEAIVRRYYDSAAVAGWAKNHHEAFDPYRIMRIPITRLDGKVFFRAKIDGRMGAEAALYRLAGKRG